MISVPIFSILPQIILRSIWCIGDKVIHYTVDVLGHMASFFCRTGWNLRNYTSVYLYDLPIWLMLPEHYQLYFLSCQYRSIIFEGRAWGKVYLSTRNSNFHNCISLQNCIPKFLDSPIDVIVKWPFSFGWHSFISVVLKSESASSYQEDLLKHRLPCPTPSFWFCRTGVGAQEFAQVSKWCWCLK